MNGIKAQKLPSTSPANAGYSLERLKVIPYKRVLIITDPFIANGDMIDLITAPLKSGGIQYDLFTDVVPDAPVGKIADGVKKFL